MVDFPQVFPHIRLFAFLYDAYPRGWFSLWRVDILPFAYCPALRGLYHHPPHDRDHAPIRVRDGVRPHDSHRRRTLLPIPSTVATSPRSPILFGLADGLLGQTLAPAPSKTIRHLWRVPRILDWRVDLERIRESDYAVWCFHRERVVSRVDDVYDGERV